MNLKEGNILFSLSYIYLTVNTFSIECLINPPKNTSF